MRNIKYCKYAVFNESETNVQVFNSLDDLLSNCIQQNVIGKHWNDIEGLQEFIKNRVSKVYIRKNTENTKEG